MTSDFCKDSYPGVERVERVLFKMVFVRDEISNRYITILLLGRFFVWVVSIHLSKTKAALSVLGCWKRHFQGQLMTEMLR